MNTVTNEVKDDRFKQVAWGAAILAGVLILSLSIRAASYIPGFVGEFFGVITGILATPVFLEVSFFILGFLIVLALNHWNMKKEGDEFVYLDQIQEKDLHLGLPEQAKYAIYRDKPLAGEEPSLLIQAEGALDIRDFTSAFDAIAAMTPEELRSPETTALRIRLARATGKEDLARLLESGH